MSRHTNIPFYKTPLFFLVGGYTIFYLVQYVANASLTPDQMGLVYNLKTRDYAGLLKPLDANQASPIAFLFIQRFFYSVFEADYSFYFLLYASGLLSVVYFRKILIDLMGITQPMLYVVFFMLNVYFLLINTTIKQYTFDLSFFLMLYYYGIGFLQQKKPWYAYTIVATLGIWFSHMTLVFVAAQGICHLAIIIRNKTWKNNIVPTAITALKLYLLPLVMLAIFYWYFVTTNTNKAYMLSFWKNNFFPVELSLKPLVFTGYCINEFARLFFIGNRYLSAFVWLLLGLGLWLILFKKKWQTQYLILLCIIGIHVVLSAVKMYPMRDRFTFYFYGPLLLIIIYALENINPLFKAAWFGLLGLTFITYFPVVFNQFTRAQQYINKHPAGALVVCNNDAEDYTVVDYYQTFFKPGISFNGSMNTAQLQQFHPGKKYWYISTYGKTHLTGSHPEQAAIKAFLQTKKIIDQKKFDCFNIYLIDDGH